MQHEMRCDARMRSATRCGVLNRVWLVVFGAGWLLAACGDDGGDGPMACPETLPPTCEITWPAATYDEIFDRVLAPSCGVGGPACHAEQGGMGDLFLYDREQAYQMLTEPRPDGRLLIEPGSPECSELVQRLDSTTPGFAMPPGNMLQESERCAFVQWIAAGAQR